MNLILVRVAVFLLILSSCSRHADEQDLEENEVHLSVGENSNLPEFEVTSSSQKHGGYNPESGKMTVESTDNKLRYIKLYQNVISVSKLNPHSNPDDKLVFTEPLLMDSVEIIKDDDKFISLRSVKRHDDLSDGQHFTMDWMLDKNTRQVSLLKKIYKSQKGDVDVNYEATVYTAETP